MRHDLLATGYSWWLPADVSTHGGAIDQLIVWIHLFMVILFVVWGLYFGYVLFRFRSRPGHEPTTRMLKGTATKYGEGIVIVVEAVLLLGFSVPIWARVRDPGRAPRADQAMVVRVVAEQFAWNIHYPGRDGEFGRTDVDRISADNPVGLDRSDPAGQDDIVTINQFHLPVDRDVLVHLTSKDVIHSFALPVLRIKQDVIPGISVPVWFRATQTTDQVRRDMTVTYPVGAASGSLKYHVAMDDYHAPDGSVIVATGGALTEAVFDALAAAGIEQVQAAPAVPTEIACAQLCGLGHYRMRGYLYIDSPSQFEQWMEQEESLLAAEDEGY